MKKTSMIANFNCKFGEEPMLPYFKEIIYPAFTNEHSRSVGDDKYFFEGVKLENSKGRYILQGVLVKKTKLEIKTEYNHGELEYVNKFYDSAPISIFSLFCAHLSISSRHSSKFSFSNSLYSYLFLYKFKNVFT